MRSHVWILLYQVKIHFSCGEVHRELTTAESESTKHRLQKEKEAKSFVYSKH